MTSPAALAWQSERDRLIGIAYRMLGDFGLAEDVVSEVAIEAVEAERADAGVQSWPAWLTTVCVRRSIDRLRRVQAAREEYPGPWLPEPVATDRLPDEVVAGREMLSIALLHLAEQLEPDARAAVVLHRAFGMTSAEIGQILDRTPTSVRQLVSRAERRLRIEQAPAAGVHARVLHDLVRAIERGDVAAVTGLLTDDAVLWADGGGRVKSALNPLFGPQNIGRFIAGVLAKAYASGDAVGVRVVEVNGEGCLSLRTYGASDVIAFEFAGDRVRGIRRVSNPDKLARVWAQPAHGSTASPAAMSEAVSKLNP